MFAAPKAGQHPSALQALGSFLKVSFGSLLVGLTVAAAISIVTKRVHTVTAEPHVEISLMFLAAYGRPAITLALRPFTLPARSQGVLIRSRPFAGAYVLADTLELSGIISLFFCAIMLSHYAKYNLSKRSQVITVTGFHTIATLSEACVYAYVGFDLVLGIDWSTVKLDFVAYTILACAVSRA